MALAVSTLGYVAIAWGALLLLSLSLLLLYGERRHQLEDRRTGPADRRRRLPDTRSERVERRTGSPDRRTGSADRRAAKPPARGLRARLPRLPWRDRGS